MIALFRKLSASLAEDVSTSGRKLAAFDGLRGLAVLTVYLSHSSGFRQRLTPWTSFHGTGHLGVYLFFVLSAFLLGHTLLERGRINAAGFYLRRFFRIAPLFYLVVTVTFALQLWTGRVDPFNLYVGTGPTFANDPPNSWAGYGRHLVFLQGNTVFWTIPCEFQFYFILPLLGAVLLRWGKRGAWALGAVALAYGVWGTLAEMGATKIYPRLALIPHHSQFFDVFLFGLLAAWLFSRPGTQAWWDRHRAALHTGLYVLGALAIALALGVMAERFFGFGYSALGENLRLARKSSLPFGLFVAAAVLACACGEPLLNRIARWRVLQLMGITGFSFYLLHFPGIRLANWLFGLPAKAGGNVPWSPLEPLAWVVGFAFTFAAAITLYLLVEKPFMVWSRRFVARPRPADPLATAPAP